MNLSIKALRKAYAEKTVTPRQVIEHILEKSEQYATHNIWIKQLTLQELEPYLLRLDTADINELPLYGIPFAIKDNIDLEGIETTAACAEFAYTPAESAFVVKQLIEAGAIPLGKTNMDQFATGLVGTRSPEPWGPCKNAFNPEYISGGSSSGSAVAVALGLASFSLGTDTAGSGRVPASFNNLVGLKPSRGLLSMTGVVPACRSLDCVSIFALTTDDANAVLEQAAQYDTGDQYARHNPYSNNHRHYFMPGAGFKFGVPKPSQLQFFGNESAQALFESSIDKLVELGGEKIEIDFEPFIKAGKLLYEGPWVAERYIATESIIKNQPEVMLPVIKTIIGSAETKTAMQVFEAEYQMQVYRSQASEILKNIDFMVTPTAGTIYTIDEVNNDPIQLNSNLGFYTNFMNLLDCSSIAVPSGFLENGPAKDMPWGVTFVSTAMEDRKLLSYANLWQQSLGLSVGKTGFKLEESGAPTGKNKNMIPLVVCGAHLEGLALNWQLEERNAVLGEKTHSSNKYRMFVIEGNIERPGMIRDEVNGQKIEIEIWHVPVEEFGSFVAAIPEPLGIGKVETEDGRWLTGFICEGYAVEGAREITELGGWREYQKQK